MKLYHMPGACSLADLIVLEWIGVPHEIVRMSRENIKSPDYLAINADGTVPLLEHGDFSLTENVAILGYLADLCPEARLLGDGTPHDRAEVMRWLGFLNSDVHMMFKPIFTPTRFLPDQAFAGAYAHTLNGSIPDSTDETGSLANDRLPIPTCSSFYAGRLTLRSDYKALRTCHDL